MKMKMRRPSEKTTRILKLVAFGLLVVGIGAAPSPIAIMKILKELCMKDTAENRRWVRRAMYDARRRGYINVHDSLYVLSGKGKRVLQEEELWELTIPKPKSWDGKWRIVAFDIPSKKALVRVSFVRHLQNLGLILYQRSVWIHPYPCEYQILLVARSLGISNNISVILAIEIDEAEILRKRFGV